MWGMKRFCRLRRIGDVGIYTEETKIRIVSKSKRVRATNNTESISRQPG